jgi:hypothetical protein
VNAGECISLWLRKNCRAYWDDCIAKELEPSRRQKVNRVTKALWRKAIFVARWGFSGYAGSRRKSSRQSNIVARNSRNERSIPTIAGRRVVQGRQACHEAPVLEGNGTYPCSHQCCPSDFRAIRVAGVSRHQDADDRAMESFRSGVRHMVRQVRRTGKAPDYSGVSRLLLTYIRPATAAGTWPLRY